MAISTYFHHFSLMHKLFLLFTKMYYNDHLYTIKHQDIFNELSLFSVANVYIYIF